jgi:hypothetical protein
MSLKRVEEVLFAVDSGDKDYRTSFEAYLDGDDCGFVFSCFQRCSKKWLIR